MSSELSVRLLPEIYSCSDQPDRWQSVLDQICAGLRARSAAVQLFTRAGSQLQQVWCARDSYSMARAGQHDAWVNNDENPRLNLGNATPAVSRVVTDCDRFMNSSPALLDLQRRLAKVGLRGGTAIMVDVAPSHYFSLIVHRALSDPMKSDTLDTALLEALAPHLRQTCIITMKLWKARQNEALISSIADQLRVGAAVCTPQGKVHWCNRSGEEMIHRSSAIALQNSVLRCARSADQSVLMQLLRNARTSSGRTAVSIGSVQDEAMQIMALPTATPVRAPSGRTDVISLVLLDQSHMPDFSLEATAALFGLAPAEARIAIALCRGESVTDYAQSRGISVGTARIQLKQAMAKTNSRRQGELVGKLYGSLIAQMH